eukprot:CAMPEP_0172437198 /NCGR_PEP_ID=MMETSP1064-20121228/72124_1 /TAXON_ID=202472 /ORGANISM="Aulacoseira subarctica , Strain CCAP 1002/5" /LENGTH=141 /DNA_ID=CAMNT_0013185649 /DNA_START=788 /DNA_END=1213 /DNA_ORIENTATION=-
MILRSASSEMDAVSVIGDNIAEPVISDSYYHSKLSPSRLLLLQQQRPEYEVLLSPHVDFGIGLRLEARNVAAGSNTVFEIAIAGSFKRHPLSGSRLPAEKSGMIMLGDSLLLSPHVDFGIGLRLEARNVASASNAVFELNY